MRDDLALNEQMRCGLKDGVEGIPLILVEFGAILEDSLLREAL
jgi:hypothetical protein